MDDSAEFYKESMTKEDYIDVVRILDYTPESFLVKNRRQYDKWKIIAMAVTGRGAGPGRGDVTNQDEYSPVDDPTADGLKGLASGCLVLEEINQHNHLLSRGADFLRVKIDGSGSATYGIMGNCKNPDKGLNATSIGPQYPGGFPSDGGEQPVGDEYLPSYFLKHSPWMNGWADPMSSNLCTCAGSDGDSWRMYVLVEINDINGVKRFTQTASSIQKSTSGVDDKIIRTCDFISYPTDVGGQAGLEAISKASDICVDYTNKMFNLARGGLTGSVILYLNHGVIVRLTSYPSCSQRKLMKGEKIPENEFSNYMLGPDKKAICYDPTSYGYNPESSFCFSKVYPERAVLRIMPVCMAAGTVSQQNISKLKFFNQIEKHYDRWDKAKEGAFKIFDEVFDFPDAKMKIRIITHKPEEFDKYYLSLFKEDGVTLKNPANYTKPYFLTGGNIKDRAGGKKGCSCTNEPQNESHYPIRPYNQFVYCPNNFTGEKTCS